MTSMSIEANKVDSHLMLGSYGSNSNGSKNEDQDAEALSRALYLQRQLRESQSYCNRGIKRIGKTMDKLINDPFSSGFRFNK